MTDTTGCGTGTARSFGSARAFDGPRTLRPQEFEVARELSVLCFGHATFQDLPRGPYHPTRKQSVEVIASDGGPVCQMGLTFSQMSVCGSRFRVASVGGVCTHPDYRGLGLATQLLEHCLEKMVARGTRLVLVSGARGLYRRAGCTPAQIFESFVLTRDQLWASEADVTVRPAEEADAALSARLHHSEPVRFVRRVEDFQEAIVAAVGGPAGDHWIVEAGGRPIGYVFLSTPWSHEPKDQVRELTLQGEWAGSRPGLVAAIPQLMDQLDLRELRLGAPWQDPDLARLVTRHGIRGDRVPMPGHTMRILDLPGLMGDLRRFTAARLTRPQRRGLEFHQEDDRCTIMRGSDRLQLDREGMTRVVMGVPGETDTSPRTAGGDLGRILSELFPLPSLLPGMNCR